MRPLWLNLCPGEAMLNQAEKVRSNRSKNEISSKPILRPRGSQVHTKRKSMRQNSNRSSLSKSISQSPRKLKRQVNRNEVVTHKPVIRHSRSMCLNNNNKMTSSLVLKKKKAKRRTQRSTKSNKRGQEAQSEENKSTDKCISPHRKLNSKWRKARPNQGDAKVRYHTTVVFFSIATRSSPHHMITEASILFSYSKQLFSACEAHSYCF